MQDGIGAALAPSRVTLHGLTLAAHTASILAAPSPAQRRLQLIGASDFQGYCTDGTPETAGVEAGFPLGWRFENCEPGCSR